MHEARRPTSWLALLVLLAGCGSADAQAPKKPAGKWRPHVIDDDPRERGPDGVTIRDFDGDGRPDLLVPFEEGNYSRLYFHPGYPYALDESKWKHIEFPLGGEDAGAGDLDMDGHVDVVLNGGQVFFNPGPDESADASAWPRMTLFEDKKARVPIVLDLDGDGHNDLVVRGATFYRGPSAGKRDAARWKMHRLGETAGPMNAIPDDLDGDGDTDILVADREGAGLVWFEQPEGDRFGPWPRRTIDPAKDIRFVKLSDIDGDGLDDIIVSRRTGGSRVLVYYRQNETGAPVYETIGIDPPVTNPKGINSYDYDGDGRREIFVLARAKGEWMAEYDGDPTRAEDWTATHLDIAAYKQRKKMDDAVHCDVDGDGDMDIVTTEEDGSWGVLWFENPWNPAGGEPLFSSAAGASSPRRP